MAAANLVITGFAMVTSVGRSYVESCAAIRAGLSRPAPIEHHLLLDEDTQENVPLVGHPLRGIGDGFFGPGLWVRLARLCMAELIDRSIVADPADQSFWSRSAILAIAPDPNGERFSSDEPFESDYVRRLLLEVLAQQLSLPLTKQALFAMGSGEATLFRALELVQGPLNQARFDRVIVLCLDSLLDDITLTWLDVRGRLKGPDAPSGLAPGEAAVAFVLERQSEGDAGRARTQVRLTGVGYSAPEPSTPRIQGDQGVRLAQTIRHALAQAGAASPYRGAIICDLNGEVWKAMEVASARMELAHELDDKVEWIMPCASVGDVGCAMPAVSMASASWRLLRQQSGAQPVLVFGLDADGEVGALCLTATK